MLKIWLDDIKESDILAKPVISDSGQVLLYEGALLKKDVVRKLTDNNIETIYIMDRANEKSVEVYNPETIQMNMSETFTEVINKKVRFDNDEEFSKITESAKNIINEMLSDPEVMSSVIEIKRKADNIYGHLLAVSSLSTIMAIKLGFGEQDVKDIALGALMHDIGLCDMGVPYINVEMDRMPAVDKLNYRKHVIIGYEMIQKCSFVNETIKTIVLSHHEKNDGSGYPFHKISERIDRKVKVVAICDYLDELVNGIGYKKRPIYEVIEMLRGTGYKYFDFDMLNVLTQTVVWFPNGSHVITNSGEIGEVIGQNKGLPDRPIIKLVKDASGNPFVREPVKDLTECLTLFITDTVD